MHAKICGITNELDAQAAADAGAWALGFNFYPKSMRFIEPLNAIKIIQGLPKAVLKVGIVVGEPAMPYEALLQYVDFIQIYADIDVPLPMKKRMILSVDASARDELPADGVLRAYAHVLLDASSGKGQLSNWALGAELARRFSLILAGGLSPNNVREAISIVRPFAIDVASGVQMTPGKLDIQLVQQLIAEVKDAH